MKVSWAFHECGQHAKRAARGYWEKKQHRLESLLTRYRGELCRLDLTLYRHAARESWEFRCVLQLPTGTLVAAEQRPAWQEAIDRTLDSLAREVKRHKQLVRKDYVIRRRLERRRNLSAAGSYLAQDVAQRRRESFYQLLEPMMADLLEDVRQQLRILVLERQLGRNEVSARDIVDDVIVRAWERFEQRPSSVDLELWLSSLVQERVREVCAEFGGASLSEQAPGSDDGDYLTPEEDIDESAYWLERTLATPLPATLEELLPDDDRGKEAESLDESDEYVQVRRALASLSAEQRDVFWLHEVAGYELAELAMMQDKTEEECACLLDEARAALRRQLENNSPVAKHKSSASALSKEKTA